MLGLQGSPKCELQLELSFVGSENGLRDTQKDCRALVRIESCDSIAAQSCVQLFSFRIQL